LKIRPPAATACPRRAHARVRRRIGAPRRVALPLMLITSLERQPRRRINLFAYGSFVLSRLLRPGRASTGHRRQAVLARSAPTTSAIPPMKPPSLVVHRPRSQREMPAPAPPRHHARRHHDGRATHACTTSTTPPSPSPAQPPIPARSGRPIEANSLQGVDETTGAVEGLRRNSPTAPPPAPQVPQDNDFDTFRRRLGGLTRRGGYDVIRRVVDRYDLCGRVILIRRPLPL
jgi:hypothetical protein